MPKRLTQQEFLLRAASVHGDTYDYSLVQYKNNSTPIKIICDVHGIFEQVPNSHIDMKTGCPLCGRNKCDSTRKLTQEEFILRSMQIHGSRYDYSKTIYTHNAGNVTIHCPLHGDFVQQAYTHIKKNRSSGCPRCPHLGVSNKSIQWLTNIMQTENIHIQHALNGGEYKIPSTKFKADGFCKDTNTIYEFYGDKWHGNPCVYGPDELCHPFSNKTAGHLFEDVVNRENTIKELGYNLVTIWESDFART